MPPESPRANRRLSARISNRVQRLRKWCLYTEEQAATHDRRKKEQETMRFGLFGSAQARRGGPDVDSGAGFRDFINYNVEAEALGYHSTFLVEHHFTGFGQVSATLNLLTWIGARTT